MTIVTKMQRQHAKHNSKPTPMPSIGLCPPCANAGPRISAGSGDGQAKGQALPDLFFSLRAPIPSWGGKDSTPSALECRRRRVLLRGGGGQSCVQAFSASLACYLLRQPPALT